MKAALVTEFGPDQPIWTDMPEPAAPPGHVVVAVAAASLAWGDILQARGGYAGGPVPPFVPGHDFAGEVLSVGEGVHQRWVGRRTYGFLPRGGGFAERIAVPVQALEEIPEHMSFAQAAAVPASFMTADCALEIAGGVKSTDIVLVQAGAGGLGSAAIQLCRLAGVRGMVATASTPERRSFAQAQGADIATDYDGFEDACRLLSPSGPTLCVESVGGEIFDRSVRCLTEFGRLVSVGASSGGSPKRIALPLLWHRMIRITGVHLTRMAAMAPDMVQASQKRIAVLLAAGSIHPLPARCFPVTRLNDAFAALESRTQSGRIIVEIA